MDSVVQCDLETHVGLIFKIDSCEALKSRTGPRMSAVSPA
jgi:hypothetical protein